MLKIPGLHAVEVVQETDYHLVYRGKETLSRTFCLCKVLKKKYINSFLAKQMRVEYEVGGSINSELTVQMYDWLLLDGAPAYFMEDFDGSPLFEITGLKFYSLEKYLKIALLITSALRDMHNKDVAFGGLSPENILYNPMTRRLKLTNFSQARFISKKHLHKVAPLPLHAYPYIAPEQTGRLSRGVDHRSDFYSLGVCLYQIFTGIAPFSANTKAELIHLHVAKEPPPAHIANRETPRMVSKIIAKLMEKTPENRYQSCKGVLYDLNRCLKSITRAGAIKDFIPGRNDISEIFQIPEKLYGRKSEIEAIVAELNRVYSKQSSLLLVSGPSGIGKSSLINGLRNPVAEQQGYFLSAKFEPSATELPYSPVVTAFQGFIHQVIAEGQQAVAKLRNRVREQVGGYCHHLTAALPELELIVGKQTENTSTSSVNVDKGRFTTALSLFIKACSTTSNPLVVFLDDLHWADLATLKFLEKFLVHHQANGVLFLGTFRDDKVSESHPLQHLVFRLNRSGKTVPIYTLPPLGENSILSLLADTLFRPPDDLTQLAKICHLKTDGNPYFVKQFLLAAHFEKYITFQTTSGTWQWSESGIAAMETTENLLPLQEKKLQTFNQDTLKILKLAACLGSTFSLQTLALVSREKEETVQKSLDKLSDIIIGVPSEIPLLSSPASLIESTIELYKFAHDRLQRAVYSLLSSAEIKEYHYQIGTQLQKVIDQQPSLARIFDITGHLNIGADLLVSVTEKLDLAGMNLNAGKKALHSSANFSAHNYLQAGLALLPGDCWSHHYELTLALHTTAAEAAYLCGNFRQAEELFLVIDARAAHLLDKTAAYSTQIRCLKAQSQIKEAIATGLRLLAELGVKIPEQPGPIHAALTFLRLKKRLGSLSRQTILNLPQLSNQRISAIMRILADIGTAAYYTNSFLLPVVTHRAITLSLTYGISHEAVAIGYTTYGFLECSSPLGDIETGYTYGQLALELLDKLPGNCPQVSYLVHNLLGHWKKPILETLSPMERAYSDCIEAGDHEIAAHSLLSCTYRYFFGGVKLSELSQKTESFKKDLERLGHVIPLYRFLLFQQLTDNLGSPDHDFTTFSGAHYNESKYLPIHTGADDRTTLFLVFFLRLVQNYIFKRYETAWQDFLRVEKYLKNIPSSLFVPFFAFFALLTLFADRPLKKFSDHSKARRYLHTLKHWANLSPDNYQAKYYLVMAEKNRAGQNEQDAMNYYELAIAAAEKHTQTQDIALAHELVANYHRSHRRAQSSKLHLKEAVRWYGDWGALAKVTQLSSSLESNGADTVAKIQQGSKNDIDQPGVPAEPFVDLDTMIKATRQLTGTIVEDELLNNLLAIMVESAGAQRGYLLFNQENKWQARLQADLEDGGIKIRSASSVANGARFSRNIVNFVGRTRESVVLDDASTEGLFIQDSYVVKNKPKSILCLPLVHQDYIFCIIYLENNLTHQAFSRKRREVLDMLGSHAAIALKNSSLYRELEETVEKLHLEIKKRKDTQLQLLHAEKLTALGRLSASIAHEFGNPLIGIQYLLQDILNRFSLSLDDKKLVYIGVEECERMKVLIRDMQQLNRPSSGKKKLFDPHKAIENVLLFQKKNLSAHRINIVREYCGDFTFIHAVEDQITQVLVNLTLNAVDAMAETGGTLTVVTNQDSEYMDIIIKDTGNGITEEDQKNIFEPFFSTKPDVEGTGLGLPVSYSIIKNHGGEIAFNSTPEKGSAFHIRLPNNYPEKN